MRAGALIALGLLAGACGRDAGTPVYKRADAPTEERVEDLLERMTTEEKVGQLCCLTGWEMYEKREDGTVAASAAFGERMRKCPPGAFWATLRADPWTRKTIETGLDAGQSAEALNALQRFAAEETRLGIPLLFAEECPHGLMAVGRRCSRRGWRWPPRGTRRWPSAWARQWPSRPGRGGRTSVSGPCWT